MSKTLQELQAVAWTFDDLPHALNTVRVLKMPIIFQQILAGIPTRKDEVPPISSLHDTLAASSHSIITFEPDIHKKEIAYPKWLYATPDTNLNTRKLEALFERWLTTIDSTQNLPNTSAIHWDWDTVALNGADFQLQRMVLPNLVARWLLQQGFKLELDGHTYDLRLVPWVSRRYIAELITEPIIRENGVFSFVLRFWLVQLPYEPRPILLHKTSVRRWATREVKIGYRRSKSLYLRRSAGYLDDAPRNDVFARLTVRNFGYGNLDYVGKQAEVFDSLSLFGSIPPLIDFLKDPASHQQIALMPIESRNSRYHSIGTGLESSDHREIFELLNEAMQPFMRPMRLLSRVEQGDKKRVREDTTQASKEESHALPNLPYPIRIEVYCQGTHCFERIAEEILQQVHLEKTATKETPIQVKADNGIVYLEIIHVNDKQLTDTLGANKDAYDDRVTYIKKRYPKTGIATGILIELADFRQSELWKQDPKKAIRDGMTQTGRISQFLQPKSEKAYSHRLKQAAADLLRMMGYRHRPFYLYHPKRELPEKVDLLAFWLIQLNKSKTRKQTVYLPVVADVPYGHQHLQLIIPSATGRSECYPSIHEGIQALASWSVDFSDPNRIIQFFHSALEERNNENPTLLMLVDSNLRRKDSFEELKDVSSHHISLYGMLDDFPQIRLARLRNSANDDALFCIPPIEKSKYQGLYADAEDAHVFYSLHNIGKLHKKKTSRKLDYLKKPSSNSSTMLIQLCNLQPNDVAREWAGLVHRLRLAHTHIDIATVLPQPLHDLEAIEKYIPRHSEELLEDDDLNAIENAEA